MPGDRSKFRSFAVGKSYDFLQKWKPPGTSIVEDNANGRYLVMYREKRKSVSWTLRGHDKACFLVLQHAWEWYVENTGQERIHIHAHICTCIYIYIYIYI